MKKRALMLVLVFSICGVYSGQTKKVPQDYQTIQAAINAAKNGDTVLVSEGRYYENINYKGKGIVITSKFYQTQNWQTVLNTIIDGSKCTNKDTASTVQFLSKEDSAAVLDGFTITGGSGTKYLFPNGTGSSNFQEGGGVVMHYSSAVIKNNIIINNVTKPQAGTTDGGGGGIATMYGGPTIINNIVASNVAGYAGGVVLNWSGGKVRNNIIYHNSLSSGDYGNGGIMIWQAPKNTAWVENNTIIGNKSLNNAGGISISLATNDAIPVVKNNIVWANRQPNGGQVLLPQNVFYNDIEDYSDATNISVDPKLNENTFALSDNSPCIDAGDPTSIYNDKADSANSDRALTPSKGLLRNDMGAFGGSLAKILPSINVADVYTHTTSIKSVGKVNVNGTIKIDILNLSSCKLTIDSVTAVNKSIFTIPAAYKGKSINFMDKDTLTINYNPNAAGRLNDTIKVYYKASNISNTLKVVFASNITGIKDNPLLNSDYKLYQCYPNPFNPSTQIKFSIAKKAHTSLKIFDCVGRCVETLIDEEIESGMHNVTWNPKNGLASGIYLVKLTSDRYSETKKIVFQK